MSAVWTSDLLGGVSAPRPPEPARQYRDESEHTLVVHDDFLSWLGDEVSEARQKRARYCLRELLVRGVCARRKNVQGAAKGWVRTQLGGTSGSHFYLWWAPYGYPAVDGSDLVPGEVLVRAVRHHDQTDQPLDPGRRVDWHVLDASLVHDHDDTDLTEEQAEVVAPSGAPIRLVRGYPGSGKTTALQQAASHRWGERVLYVTFSNRLAQDSSRYFRTFAPEDVTVDSVAYPELIAGLRGESVDLPTVHGTPLWRRLAEHLAVVEGNLGPWAGRYEELYAELHAYAVGHALPVQFRELPAAEGPILERTTLVGLRADVLGQTASEKLGFVAERLAQEGLLEELFPDLRAARSLLDRSAEPLPERFADFSAVFIDEVQDLTVVEAMLALTVIARVAWSTARMPQVFIAGDEGQTVRPTAFGWNWLGDLITLVFGDSAVERSEFALTSSMRSPRTVAALVEATRSHYRILPKGLRPAGMNFARPDADTDGKVLYCHVPDDSSWRHVEELFADHASAQLVYPGTAVPPSYDAAGVDVAASDQVKGLDFDLVGVVDAGSRQIEIADLAEKAETDPLAGALGRTVADQFRVAVSRSRENLLLLDRNGDYLLAIRDLMSAAEYDPVRPVEVEHLGDELADDVNPVDRLDSQLDAINAILELDPVRALKKARLAADYLSRITRDHEVPQPLQTACARLLGIALALVAIGRAEAGDDAAARKLNAEAHTALAGVGLAHALDTSVALSEQARGEFLHLTPPSIVLDAVTSYQSVRDDLPPLEPVVRTSLTGWLDAVAKHGVVRGEDIDASVAVMDLVVEALQGRADLSPRRRDALLRTADSAEDSGDFDQALRCLEEVDDASVERMAHCLENLARWEEAAALHEASGNRPALLRCLREIPDIERAIDLAEEIEPAIVGRLRWAQQLVELVRSDLVAEGPSLTNGERTELLRALSEGLDRAVSAVPVEDPAVDIFARSQTAGPADDERAAASDALSSSEPASGAQVAAPAAKVGEASEEELVSLRDVSTSLGIHPDDGRAVCRALGIRPVGEDPRITSAQAARLRKRVETRGVG